MPSLLKDFSSRALPAGLSDRSTCWHHGRRKEEAWGVKPHFENFSNERLFRWFRVGKNKFHHFWPYP